VTGLVVDGASVRWHRLRANHLAARLPAGSFTSAAFAGLQDSAPRAALVALHARVERVAAGDWAAPSLVQTWAPRGAVFVVPRDDLAVFAVGIVPRDPELRRLVHELAARAGRSVTEERVRGGEASVVGPVPSALAAHFRKGPVPRLAFAVGGVELRWDARTTSLLPGPPLDADEEEARRELARRFLRSLGPATPELFAAWAGVAEGDARETFRAIAGELVAVEWEGGVGWLLAADADALAAAEPLEGTRLVPFGGDPVLQPGYEGWPRREGLPPWACSGLAVVDGEAVAAWGRRGQRVTLMALGALSARQCDEVEREASSLPVTAARVEVMWRPPED
jgi:hypothetical protein